MIPKMTEDLKIIQGLSDLPNSEDGLTADQLKAKFDEAALALQAYINDKLIPALVAAELPFEKTTAIDAGTIQAAIENVQAQLRDASTGTIVNGSVTKEKLAAALLARTYGGRPWVSAGTPDSEDNPDTDFPLGQVWLRPGFTVLNDAGDAWTGSGCTAEKSGLDVVITGSAQVATVTAAQNLTGLGNQGDRVRILFTVQDRDSEITALTASVNGGTAQEISGSVALEGTLSASGSLSVLFSAAWPSASLADGSVTIGSYTVVNLDKLMRQIPGAEEIPDWAFYLQSLTPFTSYTSPEALFIQDTPGSWYQISFDVLPVRRGGTGLSALASSRYFKTTEDGAVSLLSKEEVIEDLGSLRIQTGTYTGTGEAGTITLPVEPKLLLIFAKSVPTDLQLNGVSDNPIVLGNGGTALEKYGASTTSGSGSSYYSHVSLSGKSVTFSENHYIQDTDPSSIVVKYGNRSGVTYGWVAIY